MRRTTLLSTPLLIALGFAQLQAQSAPARSTPSQPVRSGAQTAEARQPRQTMMPGVNPALLNGLKYRLVGPSRGGRVTAVTGVPSQPRTFYMGVASGGLFRTTDGGATWVPITDGKVPVGSMGAIAVADSNPDIIYLGTGSDGVRSNVSTGRGVYKTTDAGKTWQFIGLYNAGQIGAVRVHPSNPDIAWVAAGGDIFKANTERGIFKTTDGGKTWKKTLFLSDTIGAMDVELQPGNPNTVYAWMSRLERKPWTIISGAKEGGFYKSTDGGETFAKIASGLPSELIGKGNMAVTAANANRIYALVEAAPGGGMYRSDDAGQTWNALPSPAQMIWRPFYYTTIGADPTNADVVYGGAEGFWKSTDGGKSWQSLRTPHGDNHDIWINPKDGNTLIQANDGGANVSFDGGKTWTLGAQAQMNQPTSEIYGVWLDNQFPYKIYGAQQDNSTLIISSQADPYNADDFRDGPGCETGPIMPHPSDPDIVYGSCKGQYEWMNLKTGQAKRYWVGGQSLYGNPARDLILRFQRVSPMATSPHDPEILYYGSQHVHRTRDKGVTWERISPDLTANQACCQGISGEPITRDITGEEFYSTLYAITESPLERGVIWTGANDGPFHVTRDNGKTWTNITPKDLPPGGRVQWIEASPHRKGSAYYATYRYLLGDYQPYFYLTNDYGKTWTRLTDGKNGIPADWPTRVVREDPDREGLLYAGTEFGMFISFDNGAHWQSFQLNLPNVPITDIKVHRKDLVVSTQGRAIWILDNLSSLHQVNAQVTTAKPYMYKPRDGYRTRVSPNVLGPMFEYFLPAEPAGRGDDRDPGCGRGRREHLQHERCTARRRRRARGTRRRGWCRWWWRRSRGCRHDGRAYRPRRRRRAAGARDEDHGREPVRLERAAPLGSAGAARRLPGPVDRGRTDVHAAVHAAHRSPAGRGRPHRRRSQGAVRAQHADARASSRGDASHRTRARGAEQAQRQRSGGRTAEAARRHRREAPDRTRPVRQTRASAAHQLPRGHDGRGRSEGRARCARSVRRVEEGARRDSRRVGQAEMTSEVISRDLGGLLCVARWLPFFSWE